MFSFVEDTVLDPFAGTASTMVGAIRAERNSIGVELSPRYVHMARKRLEQEMAQASMLSSRALVVVDPEASRTALSRTG